jgi:hypothetical protein
MIDGLESVVSDDVARASRQSSIPELAQLADDMQADDVSSPAVTIAEMSDTWARLVAVADQLPAAYRQPAFTEFVRFTLNNSEIPEHASFTRSRAAIATGPLVGLGLAHSAEHSIAVEPSTALGKVEAAIGVPENSLARAIQISGDGSVQILARVEGRSLRERQVRLSQIVCFVREKGLGEMKTDMEKLRAVCMAHGDYDSANFTANFRREGSIRETTIPGTKERLYILSPEGVEGASALLRQLAGS